MIKQVSADYNAPKIESEIQSYWTANKAYEKTKEYRSSGPDFSFVDGPPYTTGFIHLGTAMNKTIKDVLIRYWRMNGYNVRDQPGFDMHGLPIEVQVEKKLALERAIAAVNASDKSDKAKEIADLESGKKKPQYTKQDIEAMGVDKFISECQSYAMGLHKSMTEEFKSLGVWMDWNHPYQTLKLGYIESAWWTLARAYDQGLLYSADRVQTWCPRCETALAAAEIEYSDETDPSVTVIFPLKDSDVSLLIWTTTPWTLPSNMAVAVNPELTYVEAEFTGPSGSRKFIVAEHQAEKVAKKGGYDSFKVLAKKTGKELEGLAYLPPFDIDPQCLKRNEWVYKVVTAPYVEDDNTGLVHTAPGFGPDDYDTGKRYGMEPFCPVNEGGRFTDAFPMLAGKKTRAVNDDIIAYLKEHGRLYCADKIKHSYGHCWRCKTPIIYRDTNQWFVKVTAIKDQMLAEVDRVRWDPEWAGEEREKDWVRSAKDWCVSRQRYWGIPMPVWQCDQCGARKVVGSYDQLKAGHGYTPGMDTHVPWIDGVTFDCQCGGTMHRVRDILDVWFDSGVASWADLDYPHREDEFKRWWPPKFIVEAHDQTRGWFYSQLAAGIVSFGRAPYDEIMMHGWVLAGDGRKMSKSLGNTVSPMPIIREVGADPLRLYLLGASAPWLDTPFQGMTDKQIEEKHMKRSEEKRSGPTDARKILNTYWNVVNFASTYMNLDGYEPEQHTLASVRPYLRNEDLWMLSRTEKMKETVRASLESRELHLAVRALDNYILEDLSRWYVHLVRDRSWTEDQDRLNDKNASYYVLHYSTMSTALMLAPFCPHIAEAVYQSMGGQKLSVHMEDWPQADKSLYNDGLEHSMALIQNIIEIVAAERAKMGSKLRWPLKAVFIRGKDEKINAAVKVFEAVLAQQGNIKDLQYLPSGGEVVGRGDVEPVAFSEGELFIDFEVTPEIEAEGYARELIRRIQQMRKDMKLNVEDFIRCEVKAELHLVDLFGTWQDHICSEVRAKELTFTDSPAGDSVKEWDITGKNVTIGIAKSNQ